MIFTQKFFLNAAVVIFLVVRPNPARALTNLKVYQEQLTAAFAQQVATTAVMFVSYRGVDFSDQDKVLSFQKKVKDTIEATENSLNFYKFRKPADLPPELDQIVELAVAVTEKISYSLRKFESSLSQGAANRTADFAALNKTSAGFEEVLAGYRDWLQKSKADTKSSGSSVAPSGTSPGAAVSNAPASSSRSPVIKIENPARPLTKEVVWWYSVRFGVPIILIYIYLLIAGLILSKVFRHRLDSFVKGETQEIKGVPAYGLHLILLLPYLYLLLAYCVLLVLDMTLIGYWYITSAPRIHFAIVIGVGAVVLGTLAAIVKGFFGTKKRSVFGQSISRLDQPEIWKLCDNLAVEVETPPLDEIIVSPQPGIGVHLTGGVFDFLIGHSKRVLTIGLPSISSLTLSETKAVLAHEFGHFSNRDTAWNSLTFSTAAALQNSLIEIPKPWDQEFGLYSLILALNPALWLILAYQRLFWVVTGGFKRTREVFADRTAIKLYGADNFTGGLTRVARNDQLFTNYFVPELAKKLKEEDKMFTNIFEVMEQVYQTLEKSELDNIDKSILDQEKSSLADSHPLLKERLAYAKNFQITPKHRTESGEFKTFFKDWEALSLAMSDMYTYYLGRLIGYSFKAAEIIKGGN